MAVNVGLEVRKSGNINMGTVDCSDLSEIDYRLDIIELALVELSIIIDGYVNRSEVERDVTNYFEKHGIPKK